MYISVELSFTVLNDHAVLIRYDQERWKFQHTSFMTMCQITYIHATFHLEHGSAALTWHSSVLDELDVGGKWPSCDWGLLWKVQAQNEPCEQDRKCAFSVDHGDSYYYFIIFISKAQPIALHYNIYEQEHVVFGLFCDPICLWTLHQPLWEVQLPSHHPAAPSKRITWLWLVTDCCH